MKIFIACALVILSVTAEPPVSSRYLPPQQGFGNGGFGSPSQTYGPPGSGSGSGFGQRQTDALFRSRPSSTYGAPSFNSGSGSRRPSSQYGAPSPQYSSPSSQYGAPSSQYGAPNQFNSGVNGQFGSSGLQKPGVEYGTPSFSSAPSQRYGAPGLGGAGADQHYSQGRNAFGSAPSNVYGPPEQNRKYLPPGGRGYGDEGNGEPANYNFEYMVKDDESGNDFGHREARQGDRAEGQYYVVLPDGRKQTVEYEADQEGYKPRVSYEDTGRGLGGYGRHGQGLGGYQNGYQNQGGPY